jgi:hypothetical protein
MSQTLVSVVVPYLIWAVISIIPSIKLLRRTGIQVALAAFNLIPFLGTLVLLWIVAYSKWPKEGGDTLGNVGIG